MRERQDQGCRIEDRISGKTDAPKAPVINPRDDDLTCCKFEKLAPRALTVGWDQALWGGSMAIYRQAFERLDILRAWFGAVSDDYAITNAAHRGGLKIVFIPECLIPNHGEC